MAKYIVQHRRGSSEQWADSNVVLYDGEIGIEQSDDGYTRLKIGDGIHKYSQLPYANTPGYAAVIKKATIELLSDSWIGSTSPYSQRVNISNITENSKVDLQVTPKQLTWLQDQEISLIAKNDNKTIVIYAIGEKPSIDFTTQSDLGAIQATISETTDK